MTDPPLNKDILSLPKFMALYCTQNTDIEFPAIEGNRFVANPEKGHREDDMENNHRGYELGAVDRVDQNPATISLRSSIPRQYWQRNLRDVS